MSHTPGPWFVFGNGHCVGGPIDGDGAVSTAGDEMTTAGVAMCAMARRAPAQVVANARLIAAAPDLLAALERVMRDMGVPNPTHTPAYRKQYDQALAAIAKAKGLQ